VKARKVESKKSEKSFEDIMLNDTPKYRNAEARECGSEK
jgi:hypothetical protein